MSGPPLSLTQPVVWQESPSTTLRVHGSLALEVRGPEQRMDQPGFQAANEGASKATGSRGEKRAPYSSLQRTIKGRTARGLSHPA